MATKMARTLITLPQAEMRWLKSVSKRRGQSVALTVREAVAEYHTRAEKTGKSSAIDASAGIWKHLGIDALDYVDKLRSEWER